MKKNRGEQSWSCFATCVAGISWQWKHDVSVCHAETYTRNMTLMHKQGIRSCTFKIKNHARARYTVMH